MAAVDDVAIRTALREVIEGKISYELGTAKSA